MTAPKYSLIVPVYMNESSIHDLVTEVVNLNSLLENHLEAIFVIDGSPDQSAEKLSQRLQAETVRSKIVFLSRNFGSFAAMRAGLSLGSGQYFAVMAADLQEPPSLVTKFFACLEKDEADVVFGTRAGRADPLVSRFFASAFWKIYRRFVIKEIPESGVDIFGCNIKVRDQLISMREANSSLVGILFWIGFRRSFISYHRLARHSGKSAWTFRKKLRYLSDSVFSFTDLPIRALFFLGAFGVFTSLVLGTLVLISKFAGSISVPGYAATATLILFFAGLNSLGLGIIGSYVWRAYENTKARPPYLIREVLQLGGR